MHIKIVDSTTADIGKVIHVFGGSGRKVYGRLSGLIRITVKKIKKLRRRLKVKANRRKRILFVGARRVCMITQVKKPILYNDGTVLYLCKNGAITFNKRRKFGGKKFIGITTRFVGYRKIGRRFKMQI